MPVSVIWMSCSAWAWVTARVTSVPPPPEVELLPASADADAEETLAAPAEDAVPTDSTCTRVRTTRVLMVPVISACAPEQPGCPLIVALDRKSTRLNSSHRCISYAVFCL